MFRYRNFKLIGLNFSGIPTMWSYTTDDTIAQVTAEGYFDDPRLDVEPVDIIKVQASDGPYEVQLVGGVASVVGYAKAAITTKISSVLSKIHSGIDVSIACEGDSLTYGQDTSASGVDDPINGASQNRSQTPYPETMADVVPDFAKWNSTINVFNRGYPGDTTGMGISRWADEESVDLVFLMYGTNDANGYGGETTPWSEFKRNYRILIERRLNQGSAVVLVAPPRIRSANANAILQPYRAAVFELADEYNLISLDANDLISTDDEDCWTDGVHLTARAYSDLGWNMSAILCDNLYDVVDGITLTAQLNPWTATNILTDESYRYGMLGVVKGVDQGFGKERKVYVAVNALSDVSVALDLFSSSGTSHDAVVRTYYNDLDYQGDGPGGYHPSKIVRFGSVTRGIRLLKIETTTTNDAYLNAIEFRNYGTVTQYQSYNLIEFSGIRKLNTLPVGNYDVFSNQEFYNQFVMSFNFSSLDDTNWQGAFIATEKVTTPTSATGVAVFRKGGSNLLIRKFLNGSSDGDLLDTSGVFPSSGNWSGNITVYRNSTGWLFYVDGVLRHTESSGLDSNKGYAGVRFNTLEASIESLIVQDY